MIANPRILPIRLATLVVGTALAAVGASDLAALPAFPGAVGQGAAAVGGRGGDVYHVTTLADYNDKKGEAKIPGSLRHAIRSANGPRTIVFDVGGAIQLRGRLEIRNSRLTIAGQTAPGGITLWGYPVDIIGASDVVVRYIRVRTGDFNARAVVSSHTAAPDPLGKGAMDLDAGTANGLDVGRSDRVIIDHVSAAWGMDETLSVTLSRNVTVQHTIIAESLNNSFHPKGPHGYGTLIRGELTAEDQAAGSGGYTFYGNLWALHRARNPSIGGQQRLAPGNTEKQRRRTDVNIVNNVIYGWGDQPTHRSDLGEARINFVGNYMVNGPANDSEYIFHEANAAKTLMFQTGNMHDADQDARHNGRLVGLPDDLKRTFNRFDARDILLSPPHGKPFNFFATVADHVDSAENIYPFVIANAGASLARDAIDSRVVDFVNHRTGSLIDSQDKYRDSKGRLPGIDNLTAQHRPQDFDTDADGISDEFERQHGLNPQDKSDSNATNLSDEGYNNLEIYLDNLTYRTAP
jgi:hypothetical protein